VIPAIILTLIIADLAFMASILLRHYAGPSEKETVEGWRRELDDLLHTDSTRRAREQSLPD
jgi:hypothetical protein